MFSSFNVSISLLQGHRVFFLRDFFFHYSLPIILHCLSFSFLAQLCTSQENPSINTLLIIRLSEHSTDFSMVRPSKNSSQEVLSILCKTRMLKRSTTTSEHRITRLYWYPTILGWTGKGFFSILWYSADSDAAGTSSTLIMQLACFPISWFLWHFWGRTNRQL